MRATLSAEPTLAGHLRDDIPPLLLAPLVRPPLSEAASIGLDLILEGFLAHHGTPRYLVAGDPATAGVLAGDYCYATGLVAVAADDDLVVVRILADLVATSSVLTAADRRNELPGFWACALGAVRGGRDAGDVDAWDALVTGVLAGSAPPEPVDAPIDVEALKGVFA